MPVQLNNLELCPNFSEFDRLCQLELMLVSQIISFMFIVAKTKRAQHGFKMQCVSVSRTSRNLEYFTKVL